MGATIQTMTDAENQPSGFVSIREYDSVTVIPSEFGKVSIALDALTPAEREEFEERAAIIEFCGNEARTVAEERAMRIQTQKRQKRAKSDPGAI